MGDAFAVEAEIEEALIGFPSRFGTDRLLYIYKKLLIETKLET